MIAGGQGDQIGKTGGSTSVRRWESGFKGARGDAATGRPRGASWLSRGSCNLAKSSNRRQNRRGGNARSRAVAWSGQRWQEAQELAPRNPEMEKDTFSGVPGEEGGRSRWCTDALAEWCRGSQRWAPLGLTGLLQAVLGAGQGGRGASRRATCTPGQPIGAHHFPMARLDRTAAPQNQYLQWSLTLLCTPSSGPQNQGHSAASISGARPNIQSLLLFAHAVVRQD